MKLLLSLEDTVALSVACDKYPISQQTIEAIRRDEPLDEEVAIDRNTRDTINMLTKYVTAHNIPHKPIVLEADGVEVVYHKLDSHPKIKAKRTFTMRRELASLRQTRTA